MTGTISARVAELTELRMPFVHATVVRAQVPASARAGDDAIVLPDGSMEGFVGGQCAASSVRTAALSALAAGETMLLRVLPEGQEAFPDSPGAQVVVNPCLSGGALEIFLEPKLPPPLVRVTGDTPVARALHAIGDILGYAVVPADPGDDATGAVAAIVASHGQDEHRELRAALAAGVPYIALVASRRRGQAVLDELGLQPAERSRIHTPAGLDIKARTAAEVALSILAEVVTTVRTGPPLLARTAATAAAATAAAAPQTALDPVCGMTVTIGPDAIQLTRDGVPVYFCGTGCRDRFAAG